MYIGLNAVSKGFFMVHPGFVRIDSCVHIGENCTVLPMVLFGRAHPIDGTEIFVGDNCNVGSGATILGPIKIGNNVTIAAGAVVTKNVPDNVVVAGVPAKVVKYSADAEKMKEAICKKLCKYENGKAKKGAGQLHYTMENIFLHGSFNTIDPDVKQVKRVFPVNRP